MHFRSRQRREEPEINLIPLIDVLLVILIFLMITTTYSRFTELQIQLPTADAERARQQPQEIVVSVSARGVYSVNKQVMEHKDVTSLADQLRTVAGNGGQPPVVIVNADAQATHQAVVNVMEAARLAGLSRLTFATQSAQPR
ncbi:BIOPOLYMER TRANSPORT TRANSMEMBRANE PROTEIN [Cupriavidus taiwanensis]|uniref:BIOPOLYMER TRANSPORT TRANSMEMBRANE PROTEIN n=1 Tax=Cupriavidus taiwanensis TaxID=164546 RepID=A0A976AYU7_9BURK|nr:biopolymer transporter ExbD [Cupriavidus taiwanensis]SOZ15294.1 BIOPOLYMER TRANSPORT TRANSMEMBRANE PROTEIN [Cupriavidus taiwanensis]SOZ27538.1 BIOPOLYMER TRANSPORT TRANSMEMBRANE PROTEIN [Cupriavidus taiwanensis]SOZ45865.1 BIOPOLYMER TRANSPORT TRANSMEMBRANE PROTEIN [Cupriavidus taiwanensis]SOZ60799.1 BIOPOLYMER TRANSPORT TRANSMEMBRANE PROTEIN [Cupriavidus taiwanensis]SOZ60969.1 BIOPOLYMER TRANSPORT TRANSMEMBRANE PROTEIN [Cupriavidus taiwanensis]